MGASFISMLSAQFARFGNKASDIIISRRDYLVLVLIALISVVTGAAIAQATSTNSPASEQTRNFELIMSSNRPLSVSGLIVYLRDEIDRHERTFETMKSYTNSIKAEVQGNKTELRINNQPVAIPENGTVHRNIKTENGNVEIHVETRNSQSGGDESSRSRSRNSSSIEIDSHSSSSSESKVKKDVRIRGD